MSARADVRVAAPSDLYAATGFLPWLAAQDVPLENVFVAEREGRICAAGALSLPSGGPGTLLADLVVHPQERRRGLGEQLLRRLADAGRAWGAVRLRTLRPTDDAASLAFLARAGARALEPLVTYETTVERGAFGRGLGRRAAASRPAARPLAPADLPRIAAYYARHLGVTPAAALARLRDTLADPVLAPISLALERAGSLLGFVIFRHDPDRMLRLDYWFVDARARGIPALALLAAVAASDTLPARFPLRFQAGMGAVATHRLARELGATVSRRETVHDLDL